MKRTVQGLAWVLLAAPLALCQEPDREGLESSLWAIEHEEEVWSRLNVDLDAIVPGDEIAWTARVAAQSTFGHSAEVIVGRPRSGKGPGRVVYVLSRRNSVVEQLAALREASPALEVAEAARAVRVRRGATDTTVCPVLGRLAEIQVKALPPDEALFHGPDFKLTITHASRPTRQYADLVEGGDDLAKWCAEIVAAVEACDGRVASE